MIGIIRISFLSATLFLLRFIQQDEPKENKVQLWTSGPMHANEVIGKTGENWFGLYRTNRGLELIESKVTVLDSSTAEGLHDKFVKVDQPYEMLFLVRGLPGLKNGPVPAAFYGHNFLKPGQSISLQLSRDVRDTYSLFAEGTEGKESIAYYRISIYCNQKRQSLLYRAQASYEGSPLFLWAGDLDRDGKLDLLLDVRDHYNATEPTLFLSSKAGTGELVKRVATHKRIGC